jgi:predicted MFS family arabinose efflux permease
VLVGASTTLPLRFGGGAGTVRPGDGLVAAARLGHDGAMADAPTGTPAIDERRVIWLVALIQFINVLDFVMVMPLGRDFARALGFPEASLGLIGGSYTLAAAVAGIAGARFLDRFDRRTALTWAMLGLVVATAAGGLARDLPTMMAARIIAGAFGGPATSLAMAIVADVVPPARRGAAMSVVMAAFSVASVVGVPLGLYAAELGDWRTPFFALAVLGLGVTGYAWRSLPPLRGHLVGARGPATRTRDLLARRDVRLTLAAAAAMTFSVFMIVPYIRSFLQNNHGVADDQIKFLYLVGGIASFAVVRVTGPTVDRIGSTPVAAVGTALVAATDGDRVLAGGAGPPGDARVLAVHVHRLAARRAAVGPGLEAAGGSRAGAVHVATVGGPAPGVLGRRHRRGPDRGERRRPPPRPHRRRRRPLGRRRAGHAAPHVARRAPGPGPPGRRRAGRAAARPGDAALSRRRCGAAALSGLPAAMT